MNTRPLSSNPNVKLHSGCSVLFPGIFLVMGLVLAGLFIWAFFQDVDVYRNFEEGTCKILSKHILENDGDDGPTYAPDFRFLVNTSSGERYETSGYQRIRQYSSGRSGKEEILDRFQVERVYPCWYDPDNPQVAVLVRGSSLGWVNVLIIIPLVFVAIGLAGVGGSLKNWGKSPEAIKQAKNAVTPTAAWLPLIKSRPGRTLNLQLMPANSHGKNLTSAVLFALLWNGFMGFVVFIGLTQEEFPIFIWACLSIFILVGLGLIYNAIRQLIVWLTAGETIVEVGAEPLRFGQTTDLYVYQEGKKQAQQIQIKVVCQEKVTYRQGTDTKSETRTFYETVLYEDFDVPIGKSGWQQNLKLSAPTNIMHSFDTSNNKVIWQIVVALKVANAPDFELAFPLRIVPPGVQV